MSQKNETYDFEAIMARIAREPLASKSPNLGASKKQSLPDNWRAKNAFGNPTGISDHEKRGEEAKRLSGAACCRACHSKKRAAPEHDSGDESSDTEDMDEINPRVSLVIEDCDQVRRKIRNLIQSGEMKVGEFCRAIGNSQTSYRNFMNMKGKDEGAGSDTYINASQFFERRELAGIPPPKKKTKKAAAGGARSANAKSNPAGAGKPDEDKFDVSNVELEEDADREETGDVPIFETCDSMRRMINAHLRNTDDTQAALARRLSAQLPDGKKVTGTQISTFLAKKGPRAGAESAAFYAAYVYFEKLRIKQGKKKSQFRLDMEDIWLMPSLHGEEGIGFPRKDGSKVHLVLFAKGTWKFNRYGQVEI